MAVVQIGHPTLDASFILRNSLVLLGATGFNGTPTALVALASEDYARLNRTIPAVHLLLDTLLLAHAAGESLILLRRVRCGPRFPWRARRGTASWSLWPLARIHFGFHLGGFLPYYAEAPFDGIIGGSCGGVREGGGKTKLKGVLVDTYRYRKWSQSCGSRAVG